jgi:hypothetical protein
MEFSQLLWQSLYLIELRQTECATSYQFDPAKELLTLRDSAEKFDADSELLPLNV